MGVINTHIQTLPSFFLPNYEVNGEYQENHITPEKLFSTLLLKKGKCYAE